MKTNSPISDFLKKLISKNIKDFSGTDIVVYQNEDNDIYLRRLVKVVKAPQNDNQIALKVVLEEDPNITLGMYIERDFEMNPTFEDIIKSALEEGESMSKYLEQRSDALETLRLKGITEHSLVFANFVSESMLGVATFTSLGYNFYLPADKQMPGDKFEEGNPYPLIVENITFSNTGSVEISVSRTSVALVEELLRFTLADCPYKFEIVNIAREPGVQSKIIVSCEDFESPEGVIVGSKGARIKYMETLLNSERVEIIAKKDSTPDQIQALCRNKVKKIHYYFENPTYFKDIRSLNKKKALLVVENSSASMIIGKGGKSLALTNRLTNWNSRVITEADYKEQFGNSFITVNNNFDWMGAEISDNNARYFGGLLYQAGYKSVADCIDVTEDDFRAIKEFTDADCKFMVNFVASLNFEVTCPNCGEKISVNDAECPYCHAKLESED